MSVLERTADLGNGNELRLAPTAAGNRFTIMEKRDGFVSLIKVFNNWLDANRYFEEYFKDYCDLSN